MPTETQEAVLWALEQKFDVFGDGSEIVAITKDTPHFLVHKVREYFNKNNIPYENFSYDDLLPFLS